MARFSQTFLQGLLQPSYQQGLFEAAQGLGQTPAVMQLQKQQEERQNLQRQAQQALVNKDYATLRTLLPQMKPEVAQPYISQIQAGEKEASNLETVNEVTRIQSELRELMSDPDADPSTVSIRRAALEKELLAAARNLPFAQQQQVEGFSAGLEASLESQKNAREAVERERAKFDEWLADADIRDINRDFAKQRYQDYIADDAIRIANREKAVLEGLSRSAAAAYLRGGEEAKDAWLTQNPGKEDVWKSAVDQQIINDARVAEAKDNVLKTNFSYTEAKLRELGLSDADIEVIDSITSNQSKNEAVVKMLIAKSTTGELPSAQMATIFSKAAEQRIMEENDLNPRKEKDLAQIKSLAAQLGLKAAQQAQKTGKVEDGFRLLSAYQKGSNILEMENVEALGNVGTPGGKTESESEADAFIKAQQNR